MFAGNTGAAVGLNGISGNIGANLGPNGALAGANVGTSIGLDGISGNVGANLAGANVGTTIGLGGIRAVPQQKAGVDFGLNLGPLGSFNLGGNLGWDGISGNVAASVGPDGYLFDGNTGASVGLDGISGNVAASVALSYKNLTLTTKRIV